MAGEDEISSALLCALAPVTERIIAPETLERATGDPKYCRRRPCEDHVSENLDSVKRTYLHNECGGRARGHCLDSTKVLKTSLKI